MLYLHLFIGVLLGVLIVSAIAAYFLKSQNLKILLVNHEGPGFLITHEDMMARFITSKPNGLSFPVGQVTRPQDLSEVELGMILAKKNPVLLNNLIQPIYPQYFAAYEINSSISQLINVLIKARENRRPKHIDRAIGIIYAYADTINQFYKWKERKSQSSKFTERFIHDFHEADIIRHLNNVLSSSDCLLVYNSLFKPWENEK